MKRYVRSKVLFTGEPERIKEITEELGKLFDFNKIIPLTENDDPAILWGTEAGPEEQDLIVYQNGTKAEYTFDTLKTAPLPVYEKLAERYPDVELKISYASEDYGNDCGSYEGSDGHLQAVGPEDPFVFACDVWEVDPDEQANEEMINYYEE